MSTQQAPVVATSAIVTMHQRYEAAWRDYNAVDSASIALKDSNEIERCLKFRYADAMRTISAETDALRVAILFQVPTTWPEALILQYHIQSFAEPHTSKTEDEGCAVEVASDTLFDFMCDAIEHEDKEGVFQQNEHIVSDRRRYRTGKVGT